MAGVFKTAGFSEGFYESLTERPDPPEIDVDSYGDTPLGRLVIESVRREPAGVRILTRVRSDGDERLALLSDVAGRVEGCAVVSERLEASRALERLQEELVFMLGVWFLSALVLLSLVRRSPAFGLRACVPAVFGLLCAAGIFGYLDRPVTPVAAAALTLVMGLG